MTVRLAIVDGQTLARYGLRHLADQQADIDVVTDCSSAAEATRALGQADCDVVVLGSVLPDDDGLRLARDLRHDHASLGIVVLAARDDDEALFRAMDAGASAFVARSAPAVEVLGAIRHAAVAATSFTASGLPAALARRRAAQTALALSGREAEVLSLLRDGMSVPAIARAMFISYSTAKTYVARLYDKLGAANRSQALIIALRHGLIDYGHDSGPVRRPTMTARCHQRGRNPPARDIPHGTAARTDLSRWLPASSASSLPFRYRIRLHRIRPSPVRPGRSGRMPGSIARRPAGPARAAGWSRPARSCWPARLCFPGC